MLALGLLAALLAGRTAGAETLRLRSGEHEGFTRLVLPLPAAGDSAPWELRRLPSGYRLRSGDPAAEFDLSQAFRLIARDRISGLAPGDEPGSLDITLGCDCHARAFPLAGQLLVIDIADGPPSPTSRFEDPLAPDSAPVPQRPQSHEPVVEALDNPLTLPPLWPQAAGGWTVAQRDLDPGPFAALRIPSAQTGPANQSRLSALERALQWQLSRAMSQGLVAPGDLPAPIARPEAQGPGADRVVQPDPAGPGAPVSATTAYDRAFSSQSPPSGPETCPPAEDLAVGDWIGTEPFDTHLAALRGGLLAEFDRPDPERVGSLARFYVGYGLGSEAHALLRAFPPEDQASPSLAALAGIVDPLVEAAPSADMRQWASCPAPAPLWAALAQPETLESADPADILRSFSALPVPLRQALGPRLAGLFLKRQQQGAARSILDALSRPGPTDTAEIRLLRARISLAEGHPDAQQLAQDLAGQGEDLPQAVVLALESYLAEGGACPAPLVDLADTLAYEQRSGPQGLELLQVLARARAAQGAFGVALANLSGLPEGLAARESAEAEVFAALVDRASEGDFLTLLFDADAGRLDRLPAALRLRIAQRLVRSGFSVKAQQVAGLDGAVRPDSVLRAELAALSGDPAVARALLVPVIDGGTAPIIAAQGPVEGAAPQDDAPGTAGVRPGAQPATVAGDGHGALPETGGQGALAASRAWLSRSDEAQAALKAALAPVAAPEP